MQHLAALARIADVSRALDLGSGLGYSTLWIASAVSSGGSVIGIDDAWFAKTPEHFDAMIALLRPGGLLTMANWFRLVDAISGEPRNEWASFAGPSWRDDVLEYALLMANRSDLSVVWVTRPPIGFATIHRRVRCEE
jgi:hypothetical protein